MYCHASNYSHEHSLVVQFSTSTNIFQATPIFAFTNPYRVGSIENLFLRCSPTTISLVVPALIISTLQRSTDRSITHVNMETLKFFPSWIEMYSATTPFAKPGTARITRSLDHTFPRSVGTSMRHAVLHRLFRGRQNSQLVTGHQPLHRPDGLGCQTSVLKASTYCFRSGMNSSHIFWISSRR